MQPDHRLLCSIARPDSSNELPPARTENAAHAARRHPPANPPVAHRPLTRSPLTRPPPTRSLPIRPHPARRTCPTLTRRPSDARIGPAARGTGHGETVTLAFGRTAGRFGIALPPSRPFTTDRPTDRPTVRLDMPTDQPTDRPTDLPSAESQTNERSCDGRCRRIYRPTELLAP